MSTPTLWRYALPNVNHEGWAVFLLSSDGMLAVCSDFGDYAYHWPPNGWGKSDFREFLLRVDADYYLVSKLGHGRQVYRGQQTERNIKRRILELRRGGCLGRDEARSEWDLISRVVGISVDNEIGFHEWYLATRLDEASFLAEYSSEPQLLGFAEKVWPRFRELLRKDLENGGAA